MYESLPNEDEEYVEFLRRGFLPVGPEQVELARAALEFIDELPEERADG